MDDAKDEGCTGGGRALAAAAAKVDGGARRRLNLLQISKWRERLRVSLLRVFPPRTTTHYFTHTKTKAPCHGLFTF